MSVYLDDANIGWRGKRWCHLYADSLAELEAFARRVGLRPSWLQHPTGESGLPHYDVTGHMLDRCVTEGALLVAGGDGTYRRLRQALGRGEYPLSATETTEESPYECDHCADGEAFIGSKSCAYCGRDTEEE